MTDQAANNTHASGRLPGWIPGAVLRLDAPGGDGAMLRCRTILREIPGHRVVCLADWKDAEVYAKLYRSTRAGRRHWKREIAGLEALARGGTAAPDLLWHGGAEDGRVLVVLLRPVPAAESLLDAWRAADPARRRTLLERLVQTVARQHRAGIRQTDAHFRNFLLSGEQLFTLDGGGIRDRGSALGRRASLDNLALLLAQVGLAHDALVKSMYPVYAAARGWSFDAALESAMERAVARMRRKRRDRYLKKVFRECTALIARHGPRRREIYDRGMDSPAFRRFLDDPDASLEGGHLLKAGNTCTVWRATVDGHALVIKRYNMKNALHRLGRALRRTRAAVSWENAHRLGLYQIPTASPVALIEERVGLLRGRAYFVSRWVEGPDCRGLLADERIEPARKAESAAAIAALVRALRDHRISHGDMKGTNIILGAETGAVIIDLDAMREHADDAAFRRRHRRDLSRLMRNWPPDSDAWRVMARALGEAGIPLS